MLQIREEINQSTERWCLNTETFDDIAFCLRKEIQNIPSHFFGDHSFCSVITSNRKVIHRDCFSDVIGEQDKTKIDLLKEFGIFEKMKNILTNLSRHSGSLLHGLSTNSVESANNIVCMIFAGKRCS